ncbi:hypothetical protein HYN48_14175 [Flavobacterium magnum]|uniref:Uncharacterized protein n=1 Tax=Flavobacterium magnum TaxID=2162713 RepID=A0A2S0RGS3_9FLAO|nr:hypothetical protein [Flavobacterium magnum]AWA31147.1 hypothetical protein HYN48_14175 [Flavobacterium magnum]
MKKLLLLSFFSILSCKSKDEVAIIEMMSYEYETQNAKWFVHSYLYTSIDENGFSKNIEEIDSLKSKIYSSQINKQLITQIIDKTSAEKESYYRFKRTPGGCYFGPIFRFRITYENGKQMSFIFRNRNYKNDSKYILFKSLYDQIIKPTKKVDLDNQEFKQLNSKFEKYKAFVYHKDTLELPLPPPPPPAPKIDEVKFTQ